MATNIPAQIGYFLNYKHIECGVAELTRQSYREALNDFFSFLGHKKTVTQADIERYQSSCLDRKLSPRTVTHHISVLREFFKCLLRDRLIQRDPMVRIESPKMWKRLPRVMSESEIQRFLDAPGPNRLYQPFGLRDRAICETFYASGIRVSELISAKLVDLNLVGGLLTVFGKGSKERMVPLGRRAIDALRAYLSTSRPFLQDGKPASAFLFVGLNRPHLTREAICYILRERAKRAGISHVYPHKLRHSAATHMLDGGADLRVIQEILGHADISTTEIYTHVSTKRLSDVFRACHPRNNPTRAQMGLFDAPVSLVQGPVMCTQCRNPVCDKSRSLCAVHLQLHNAASNRSHKRTYVQKKLDGVCANCSELAVKGRVQCERHLRLNREAGLRRPATKRRAEKKLAA